MVVLWIRLGRRQLGATQEIARFGRATAERDFGTAFVARRGFGPPALPGIRDDLSCLFGQNLEMGSLCLGFLQAGRES